MPCSDWNVLVAVRVRCAVHKIRDPGNSIENATIVAPTKNVLPTWRGMLRTTPPTVAAYFPSARRPKTSCPSPSCQPSKSMPKSAHVSRICHQPVVLMPSGMTTWRATSDSRSVERVAGGAATDTILLDGRIVKANQAVQLAQLFVRRRDGVGRHLAGVQLLGQGSAHRREHVAARPVQCLGDRLWCLLLALFARLYGTEVCGLVSHQNHLQGFFD